MDLAALNALISQAPGVAGVVIIVFAFLKYLDKRDKDWRSWMAQQNSLVMAALHNLEDTVHAHDEWERKMIESARDDVIVRHPAARKLGKRRSVAMTAK